MFAVNIVPSAGSYGYGIDRPGIDRHQEQDSTNTIEINAADNALFAYKAGSEPQQIDLLPGETVRAVQTRGQVGSVVTSERVLAIPADRFQWQSLSFDPGDITATSSISNNLVLFVTEERVIVFDSTLYRFEIFDLPVGQRVVAQAVDNDVIVFVTSEQAVGYVSGLSAFKDFPFSPGEMFQNLEASESLISIRTSNRLLRFPGPSAQWAE